MRLVEILLPVNDNAGRAFEASKFAAVRNGKIRWRNGFHPRSRTGDQRLRRQDPARRYVIMEVMTDRLDQDWWAAYRQNLECEFAEDEIIIRATAMTKL
ncbi:MAG: hypothetical protein QOF14_4401 [Hyphomicrobiales bacterium]|jgi:hypothetical protein|nr:hypothetical protein [Hyphomicrobiales bacterium]